MTAPTGGVHGPGLPRGPYRKGDPQPTLPPWQLGLRFGLEMAALVAWGLAGFDLTGDAGGGVVRWLVALVLVTTAATLWGTFRVDGDPPGKEAPVRVPGTVRLVIELVVLLGAAVALTWSDNAVLGVALAVLVVAHYATTLQRTRWLLAQ